MSASAVGGKGKNGDINQVPYTVLIEGFLYSVDFIFAEEIAQTFA